MTDTTIRRIVWCALLTVCLTGCSSQKTSSLPIAVYHWVWHSDEYATYQDQFGDGCGHIMRRSGGRAYSADANLLANDSKMLITVSADYNDFSSAKFFVEDVCRQIGAYQ